MKASELITKLTEHIQKYGDKEVAYFDNYYEEDYDADGITFEGDQFKLHPYEKTQADYEQELRDDERRAKQRMSQHPWRCYKET